METHCADSLLTIRRVRYPDIIDAPEAQELLAEYSAECSIPTIGVPNPQRAIYQNMETSGLMHSFGIYKHATLVGFVTLLIFPLPHYGKLVANVESLFLAKPHRKWFAGRSLMRAIEGYSRARDCTAMLYNARSGSQMEKMLLGLPNYERTNSVFVRTLA